LLGLGILAKGPLHLVFFYAVVVAILYRARALAGMFNAAHLLGVALMLGIFAAWAIPCLQMMQNEDVTQTWTRQFSGRLSAEGFQIAGWLMNIPRGLGYFLPWTFLLGWALVRRPLLQENRTAAIVSGLSWGIALSFIGVSLLPGALARYTMPLLAPAAWLAAVLLTSAEWRLPRWLVWRKPAAWPQALRLPGWLAVAACVAIALYALVIMPFRLQREKVRPIARQINAALPPGERLFAIDPDYQPALFYVREPLIYENRIADVPREARFLLIQPDDEQEALATQQWAPRTARAVLRLTDYRRKQLILLEVREP
jgi:4-amino-4-deoxy-L-arabinose transferase-like glycosyltransferase